MLPPREKKPLCRKVSRLFAMSTLRFELEKYGSIALTLRPDAAPATVAHISSLVAAGLYNGCCFYRSDFVIQCGECCSLRPVMLSTCFHPPHACA